MSSPNLNNSVLLGCTLSYVSVFLFGLDGGFISSGYEIICAVSINWHSFCTPLKKTCALKVAGTGFHYIPALILCGRTSTITLYQLIQQ